MQREKGKSMTEYYLAVDIGASSGRHILGHLEDGRMVLEEVYRFPNGMKETHGHLCWDTDELFSHIKEGMKRCKELGKLPVSMGIDTWAVDYVFLDHEDRVVKGEGGAASAVEGLGVAAAHATGDKCERCWKYSADIGTHAAHPTLCARCAAVVEG